MTFRHYLDNLPFFGMLKQSERDRLTASASQPVTFNKGDLVFRKGALRAGAAFITKGYVKLYVEIGNEYRIADVIGPGNFPGIVSLPGYTEYQFTARAISDARVVFVDMHTMEELMVDNPAFCLRVAQTVSRVATRSLNYFLLQNMKNVRGKLAEMLLYLSREIFRSDRFELSFTRREMADFVGTTTETTIRVLNEFRRDGLIRIDQRIVKITDEKRLEMLSKKG